jgi:hypothetical protein
MKFNTTKLWQLTPLHSYYCSVKFLEILHNRHSGWTLEFICCAILFKIFKNSIGNLWVILIVTQTPKTENMGWDSWLYEIQLCNHLWQIVYSGKVLVSSCKMVIIIIPIFTEVLRKLRRISEMYMQTCNTVLSISPEPTND